MTEDVFTSTNKPLPPPALFECVCGERVVSVGDVTECPACGMQLDTPQGGQHGDPWIDQAVAAVGDAILDLLTSAEEVAAPEVASRLSARQQSLLRRHPSGDVTRAAAEAVRHFDAAWSGGGSGLNDIIDRPDPTAARYRLRTGAEGHLRLRRLERAVKEWVKQLVDVSGNNRLLYYRDLKQGTLDLTAAETEPLRRLLGGDQVPLAALFPPVAKDQGMDYEARDRARKRARTIHKNAQAIYEEKGIDTLFLALGMATWTTETSSATPSAPVALRPLEITPRGAAEAEYDLALTGDWEVNETLLHLLATEFHATEGADDLQATAEVLNAADPAAVRALFGMVERMAADVPSFSIRDRVVVGTFQYQKLPMVKDLQASVQALAKHDLVAALAGDAEARQALLDAKASEVSPSDPDVVPPDDEFLILDADSSQSYAINAAVAGEPLVVQGPPGTGKSQTIANLIATNVARGRRVLFVAEKRAAIDAVTKRLRQHGLGELVMDLHGGLGSKKQFAASLGQALAQIESVPRIQRSDLDRRLTTTRSALRDHTDALHEIRAPWGVSIHEVETRLLALRHVDLHGLKFLTSQITDLGADVVGRVREELLEWADLAEPVATGRSPWSASTVRTPEEAERALRTAEDLATTLPDAQRSLRAVLAETGLPTPDTVESWERTLALLRDVAGLLETVEPELFAEAPALATALAPGSKGAGSRFGAQLFNGEYRRAKKAVRARWRGPGKPSGAEAARAVARAIEVSAAWTAAGADGIPKAPADLDAAASSYSALSDRLAALGAFISASAFLTRRPEVLEADVDALIADQVTLFKLPRIRELETFLERAHLGPVLDAVRRGVVCPEALGELFDAMWLHAIRAAVVPRDSRLASFDGNVLHRRVNEFVAADLEHIESTAARVRRLAAEHAVAVCNQHPDQDALVRREAAKRSRHIPTRQLFDKCADVLTALRPCWTMSPLVVSQVLPNRPLFDIVIFDEASQILPADAVPALLRAPQAVVAGDRRQLPPTTFFNTTSSDADADEDELDDIALDGFESILDVLDTTLGSRMLTWHYRSEDERLIAFSNHRIYDGALTTFPGAANDACVRHELVRHRPGEPTDTRSNPREVERVVELMIDHARTRPDESLGVITMGLAHAERIDALLRQRLRELEDPALDEFFDESSEERTFVKNIERVQGDERDAIILSVGYGKTPDGRLLYRFGPLLQEGGERRLNVAVTRARKRLTLVSSFSHADMDPSRSSARGVELLRQYLKFAESGGIDLEGADQNVPLNPFELDVKHRLEQRGIPVHAQYGISGFRLDFALPHPSGKGYALAVEADGASYHSSPTTRDRDRLRQQVLEQRGWRFHRIWSTDWFNDPEREADRVADAYRQAVAAIDAGRNAAAEQEEVRATARRRAAEIDHPTRTSQRPALGPKRASIRDYYHSELVALAQWIASDGLLRTESQFIDEMADELGFRKGKNVVSAIRRAITEVQRRSR